MGAADQAAAPSAGSDLDRLHEERDFLLTSIEDLDREHAAGDVDPEDYDELRRGYVARTAEVMAAIDAGELARRAEQGASRTPRRVMWVAGCVVFAVVAGVLLAQASGTRVGDQGLTGTVDAPGVASDRCRSMSLQDPEAGIECFDDVLASAPDDIDALTYQGWAFARLDRFDEATERFDRVVELEPTYPDVWVFIASVRNSTGDFQGAQEAIDTLYSLNPAPIVLSTMTQLGLEREVAIALLSPEVAACWALTEAGTETLNKAFEADPENPELAATAAELNEAIECFEGIVDTHSADAAYLTLRAFTLGLFGSIDRNLGQAVIPTALVSATEALRIAPDDPSALAVRAAWAARIGEYDMALADLDALGDRRISPLIAAYVPPDLTREGVMRALARAETTTTTAG